MWLFCVLKHLEEKLPHPLQEKAKYRGGKVSFKRNFSPSKTWALRKAMTTFIPNTKSASPS